MITQTARTALREFWTHLACTRRKMCQRCERMYPSLNTPRSVPHHLQCKCQDSTRQCNCQDSFVKVLGPATRRDGNGEKSKVQGSIGQYVVCRMSCWHARMSYVVCQRAGTLRGMHTSEKVSVTGKESSKYAPNSSTAKHIQSAPTRTANMKGNAGSEDN